MPAVLPDLLHGAREAASVASVAISSLTSLSSTTVHSGGGGGGSGSHGEGILGPLNGADVVMILLSISVFLHVINNHFIGIPSSVAMAFGAILMTVVLLILSHIPMLGVYTIVEAFRSLLKDFPEILLNYMLGFLLFAAAIEVDFRKVERILSTVIALSVVSTFLSTFIVGTMTYFLMQNISHMDFAWCLLFGAIVSPTDPVTVMSILSQKPDLLPESTRYFVICESLLNDAMGVVLYFTFREIVQKPDISATDILSILFEFVFKECCLGALIGVLFAWIAYSAIRTTKESLLQVLITFVLVGNINMVCRIIHASIPLASVGAGLFIGTYAPRFAMDEATHTFHKVWQLADETLNSILFLLIGAADLFWNPQDLGWSNVILLTVSTICISLFARFLAVVVPLLAIIVLEWAFNLHLRHTTVKYRGGTIAVLTWAGMRGGISIALALGVPDAFVKHAIPGHMTYGQLIFFMTFILVVFSIVVQGMLFEPVVNMINRVSYQILPSGGLSTMESQISFGHDYGAIRINHDESVLSGDMFDNEEDLYKDFEGSDSSQQMDNYQSAFPRAVTDTNLHGTAGMASDVGHIREYSNIFVDLPELTEPPTIQQVISNLRRSGTFSIQRWFAPRPPKDEAAKKNGLKRSHTEPDTHKYLTQRSPDSG
ncbi:Na(+)/H(+) antiporter NhaP [Gracilariopsis chorda]|uniref:Na(+)/H(+) antiporter NhaP n=1 Tax=Gracilariopsis chorda TaxID=448386 RepID=A0A2V3IP12_9FLOR|nr:Na(+)/H(+) antiporter NhaP [Gracilariopsis chorda]|eukprot:PXF43812.1 Na(+)/H(+) antiporter NhaP [Gracilariopsis chorda]